MSRVFPRRSSRHEEAQDLSIRQSSPPAALIQPNATATAAATAASTIFTPTVFQGAGSPPLSFDSVTIPSSLQSLSPSRLQCEAGTQTLPLSIVIENDNTGTVEITVKRLLFSLLYSTIFEFKIAPR